MLNIVSIPLSFFGGKTSKENTVCSFLNKSAMFINLCLLFFCFYGLQQNRLNPAKRHITIMHTTKKVLSINNESVIPTASQNNANPHSLCITLPNLFFIILAYAYN